MLKVWSRAASSINAQYRCVACRASTTLRPSLGWKVERLQYKHLTVLFYSSIIATAAAADGQAKRNRRESLDRAIDEVEQYLKTRSEELVLHGSRNQREIVDYARDNLVHESRVEVTVDGIAGEGAGISSSGYNESMSEGGRRPGSALDEEKLAHTRRSYNVEKNSDHISVPEDPFSLSNLHAHRTSPSIYAGQTTGMTKPAENNSIYRRERIYELSLAKLASRLLLALQNKNKDSRLSLAQDFPSESTRQVLALLGTEDYRELRNISERLHNYLDWYTSQPRSSLAEFMVSVDKQNTSQACLPRAKLVHRDLNRPIQALFRKVYIGVYSLDEAIPRICYTLISSPSLPDNATFSILIGRLTSLRQFDMARMVVESMMECITRPNEILTDTMLKYYIAKKDFVGFEGFVRKLQGLEAGLGFSRLLKIDNSQMNTTDSTPGIETRSSRSVQYAPLDAQNIFSIIAGYMNFNRTNEAFNWLQKSIKCRYEDDILLCLNFLKISSNQGYWEFGKSMWVQIQAAFGKKHDFTEAVSHEEREAFFWMLRLCNRCQQPSMGSDIYKAARSRGISREDILFPISNAQKSSKKERYLKWRQRRLGIVETRIASMTQDLNALTVHVHMSHLIASGSDPSELRSAVETRNKQIIAEKWDRERKILGFDSLVEAGYETIEEPQNSLDALSCEEPRPTEPVLARENLSTSFRIVQGRPNVYLDVANFGLPTAAALHNRLSD